jgi:hypothetical protein
LRIDGAGIAHTGAACTVETDANPLTKRLPTERGRIRIKPAFAATIPA